VSVQDGEDVCKETVSTSASITMDIEDDDGMFDRHSRWSSRLVERSEAGRRAAAEELWTHWIHSGLCIWEYHSTSASWVHDLNMKEQSQLLLYIMLDKKRSGDFVLNYGAHPVVLDR
jgi:hypothetical protein